MNEKSFDSDKSDYTEQSELKYIPVEYVQDRHLAENELKILDLVKSVWDGRRELILIVCIFTIIGLFNYIFGPNEYESNSILLQESRQGNSQLQLQQLIGGNFGGAGFASGDVIPSSLYPQIVFNAEFQRELILEEIDFEDLGICTTLLEYFTDYYEPPVTEKVYSGLNSITLGLPSTLYSWIKGAFNWVRGNFRALPEETLSNEVIADPGSRYLTLTREERRAISEMRDRIIIEIDGSLITVTTRLPDALAAAEINHLLIGRIQEFVTDYRVEKARKNLDFIEIQYEEAKQRYTDAHMELARFRDQNVQITSAIARTQQEELENQRNLMFDIYNSISQQLEQARLKLQEETPVFTVLQRTSMPTSTVSGSKVLLIATILLGVIFGLVWIFARNAYQVIRSHIES